MKAAYFASFRGPIEIRDVPAPELPDDGVIIRVGASGLCRSDWHGWMGHDADVHVPHVPGHEFAGTIESTGVGVRRWKPGDRVTVPFCVGCGACPRCDAGLSNICDRYYQPGFTGWGSFAELVAIPHANFNLVRLPDAMDFVTAASLGCRFATSWRAVATLAGLQAGEWLAVFGCGGVGLSAIMIAKALGMRPVAIDVSAAALDLAREIGAEEAVDGTRPDVVEEIHRITGGGAHASIDALGSAATCRNAILSLRKRGRHVQVGLLPGDAGRDAVPMERVIAWELEIVGSHGLQAAGYGPMLALIAAGRLDPSRLVRQTVGLDQLPEVLAGMSRQSGAGVTIVDRF